MVQKLSMYSSVVKTQASLAASNRQVDRAPSNTYMPNARPEISTKEHIELDSLLDFIILESQSIPM